VPLLRGTGLEVIDYTVPGWIATEGTLSELRAKLHKLPPGDYVYVFDIFGNTATRFEQADGTLCLPMRLGGHYHYPGPVKTMGLDTFGSLVGRVGEILKELVGKKIVVPPLPRHLTTPCCDSREHCVNLRSKDYTAGAINSYSQLRGALKKGTVGKVTDLRILDGIGVICGHDSESSRPGNDVILPELIAVYGKDGVHLNLAGLKNLSTGIAATIKTMCSGSLSVSGPRQLNHNWRGFLSSTGSSLKTKQSSGGSKWRGGDRRFHPYTKKN